MILPIYAGLERIPTSLLEASADLGGRSFTTFLRVILPLAFPAVVAGSIFTFCLTLGDYIAPGLITSEQFIGTVIYNIRGAGAARRRPRISFVPDRRRDRLPARRAQAARRSSRSDGRVSPDPDPAAHRSVRDARLHLRAALPDRRCTRSTRTSRRSGRSRTTARKWFSVAFNDEDVREALKNSVLAALGATAIALVLGTLASLAVARYRFFGREVITFAVILPIALPGIVTGLALQATIIDVLGPLGFSFGLTTIIVGHATFCVVVVYNNVIARMRRTAGSLDEASADLGADSWQTFRYVMLPADAHGAARGRAAGVRALVRRGHRHGLHRRRQADAADLDLRDPRASGRAADRERRRAVRARRLDHPRVLRRSGSPARAASRASARSRAPWRPRPAARRSASVARRRRPTRSGRRRPCRRARSSRSGSPSFVSAAELLFAPIPVAVTG